VVALTKDRNTPARDGTLLEHPLAASTKIYAGAIVALDAAGNAVPGATSTTLTAVGRAESLADNSAGTAGAVTILTRRGIFKYTNDTVAAIDRTHIGKSGYLVDDHTVAATNGTNTRSVAGKILAIDPDGVWIEII
jgi:hypothetical protein